MLSLKVFYVVITLLVSVSVISLLIAVAWDFKKYNANNDTVKKTHSWVATGTMMIFFIIYYIFLKFRIGAIRSIVNEKIHIIFIIIGTIAVIFGAYINISSRKVLGHNWSDNIKIYSDHTLITSGAFKYIRHPLYSSLFCMFYGGCFIYLNWIGVLLTSVIFVPMMNYRACQEEKLLVDTFKEYRNYMKAAGRFLPKSLHGYQGGINGKF